MADAFNKLIGNYAQSLALMINGHELSKQVKEIIRDKMVEMTNKLGEISQGEVDVVHTGLQYSHFHMIRLLASEHADVKFFPCVEFDLVLVYNRYKICDCTKEKLDEMIKSCECFALMLPTDHPGYVNLKISDYGRKMIDRPNCDVDKNIDPDGYLPNYIFRANWFPEFAKSTEELYNMLKMKYSEPSDNYENDKDSIGISHDFAHTFPCQEWPVAAKNWISRSRPTNWPSEDTIHEITKGGCVLVPTGYPLSVDKEREWRVSFNIHERRLARSWNNIQKTCYCMVLMMLKTHLSTRSILTSYHVKNMMFWFCEKQFGPDEFDGASLGDRVLQLLYSILKALENAYIPHFFIPENNLISNSAESDTKKACTELSFIVARPFEIVSKLCHKLDFFDVRYPDTGFDGEAEIHYMLILYATFVQNLYRIGFEHSKKTPSLSGTCFQHITQMNKNGSKLLHTTSNGYNAKNMVDLLRPICQGFCQSGDLDKALSFYLLMYNFERDLVLKDYPEITTNIACIYTCLYDLSKEKTDKKIYEKKAMEFFQIGTKIMDDSPTLHVGYGNFLLSTKTSFLKAIDHFRKSISIEKPREEDNSLIQLDIPGCEEFKPTRSRIPGRLAAYFMLVTCLADMGEIQEARRNVNKMEELTNELDYEIRPKVLQMCAMAYKKAGLEEKAYLCLMEAFKLFKQSKKLVVAEKKRKALADAAYRKKALELTRFE
ncbi:uncharacterized protein LOC143085303 [Mytilus galloprovincialis]|uniref:uncharacterized protein LOC143085303 n=1 Tax=Mytilus galloprovincialis TaxID=29158 RepID=UPI003F7C5C61